MGFVAVVLFFESPRSLGEFQGAEGKLMYQNLKSRNRLIRVNKIQVNVSHLGIRLGAKRGQIHESCNKWLKYASSLILLAMSLWKNGSC